MNVRYVKLDIEPVTFQLQRIADLLEQLVQSTNPQWVAGPPTEEEAAARFQVMYANEREEIIQHHVNKARGGEIYIPKR